MGRFRVKLITGTSNRILEIKEKQGLNMVYLKAGIVGGGVLTLVLIIFHIMFYWIFKWKDDFANISELSARVFFTIHIALILFFAIFCVISFVYADDLARATGLAGVVTAGYALLWLWRLLWQIVYFNPSKSRTKGKSFAMHYTIILVCLLLFAVYAAPVIGRLVNACS
jgi:hypothetical protein